MKKQPQEDQIDLQDNTIYLSKTFMTIFITPNKMYLPYNVQN